MPILSYIFLYFFIASIIYSSIYLLSLFNNSGGKTEVIFSLLNDIFSCWLPFSSQSIFSKVSKSNFFFSVNFLILIAWALFGVKSSYSIAKNTNFWASLLKYDNSTAVVIPKVKYLLLSLIIELSTRLSNSGIK